MSARVFRVVLTAVSGLTWCVPSPNSAIRAAVIAFNDAMALRSIHGIWTKSADRIARQSEVVFDADRGGVLHLGGRPTHHGGRTISFGFRDLVLLLGRNLLHIVKRLTSVRRRRSRQGVGDAFP